MPVAYCQFGFPIAALAAPAVIGGSGTVYSSINAAIMGETELVYATTTLAGTTNGIVVGGAGFPVTNDELKGAYLVLTDPAPGSGKAAVWARIIDYDGATKTATLDSSIDVGVGFLVEAIFPAVITVNRDMVEDVSIIKSVLLNIGGSELSGSVDISAGTFVWLNNAVITDGIRDVRTTPSVLKMDYLTVSRKESSIYAVLRNEATNVGGTEATDCEFRGVVAGRQGICRWAIKDCVNLGIDDGDGNIAYRLLEADGIARVFSNVSVNIDGEFWGTIAFAKGAGVITSAAPNYLSLFADILSPVDSDFQGSTQSPRGFSILAIRTAGTATITASAGQVAISTGSINDGSASDDPNFALDFSLIRGRTFTGSGTLTLSMTSPVMLDLSAFAGMSSLVTVDGTGTSSGTLVLDGGAERLINLGQSSFAVSLLRKGFTGAGSITVSSGVINTKGGNYVSGLYFLANQTAGAPTYTLSAQLTIDNCLRLDQFGFDTAVTSITVGTWTISSNGFAGSLVQLNPVGTLPLASGITGGTWSISGNWSINFTSGSGSSVGIAASFAGGTATLTVAGTWRLNGGTHLNVLVNHARDNGAGVSTTVTRAGSTTLDHMTFRGAFAFVFAQVATSVCAGSGNILSNHCTYEGAGGVIRVANSAGALAYPAIVRFRHCSFLVDFESELVGSVGITGTTSILQLFHDTLSGIFVLVGTRFSTGAGEVQAFETNINGNSANFSVSFTGTRPAIYRYWKCQFQARFITGQPEVMDDYVVVASNGTSKTRGFLQVIDATTQAANPAGAATDALEGVVLYDVAATVGLPVVLVRRGVVFVDTSGVVAGDNLIEDAGGTPTRAIAGTSVAGQRVGRATEATGATNAGESYSVVNLM